MIIVICGPTGVGKTKLSIALAKKYHAEIINGDSVQLYKDLNIGSAKIKESEMDGIPHHLLNILNIEDEYSIYDYQLACRNKIKELQEQNKNIILVGGTGLYIKSALYDYTLSDKVTNNNYDNISTNDLYQQLKSLDKDIDIDKNNRKRIIRALDYYLTNHKSIKTNNNGNKLLYDALFIGLTTDRENLYNIINNRVNKMLEEGLINEVKSFYDKNIHSKILNSAIGYKEIYSYLDNKITKEEAIELIQKNSRHYAKRQYTFFKNQFNITWFNVNFNNFDITIKDICEYIDRSKLWKK